MSSWGLSHLSRKKAPEVCGESLQRAPRLPLFLQQTVTAGPLGPLGPSGLLCAMLGALQPLTYHTPEILLDIEVVKSVQLKVSSSELLSKLEPLGGGNTAPPVRGAQRAGTGHCGENRGACKAFWSNHPDYPSP